MAAMLASGCAGMRGGGARAYPYPDIDGNLGMVCRWRAAVECARVLLPVRKAVIEHDRGVSERLQPQVELRERRVPAVSLRNAIEVHEHRDVPVAVREVLLKVACLAVIKVRLVFLAVDVLDQLQREPPVLCPLD